MGERNVDSPSKSHTATVINSIFLHLYVCFFVIFSLYWELWRNNTILRRPYEAARMSNDCPWSNWNLQSDCWPQLPLLNVCVRVRIMRFEGGGALEPVKWLGWTSWCDVNWRGLCLINNNQSVTLFHELKSLIQRMKRLSSNYFVLILFDL